MRDIFILVFSIPAKDIIYTIHPSSFLFIPSTLPWSDGGSIMKKTAGIMVVLCFLTAFTRAPSLLAECPFEELSLTHSLTNRIAEECCSQSRSLKRRECLRNRARSLRSSSHFLGGKIAKQSAQLLRSKRARQCENLSSQGEACSSDQALPISLAIHALQDRACTFPLQNQRIAYLRRAQKEAQRLKVSLGAQTFRNIVSSLRELRRSKACGRGGQEGVPKCETLIDPRDTISEGNVYKIHDGLPLFVTHDGTGRGQVINSVGKGVAELRYTGLHNPDPRGLRSHYRILRSCRELPKPFYIKLGAACYEIDTPCERID